MADADEFSFEYASLTEIKSTLAKSNALKSAGVEKQWELEKLPKKKKL